MAGLSPWCPIARDTISDTPLTPPRSYASSAGGQQRPSRAVCAKPCSGTWTIGRGGKQSDPTSIKASVSAFSRRLKQRTLSMLEVQPTEIPAVKLVKTSRFRDERGFFTELYSRKDFAAVGIADEFVQDNFSRSKRIGTI